MITGFPYIVRPKEKLRCWGKVSDVQYAMRVNAERIFGINPDSIVLAMPMWEGAGNRIIDYSKYRNHGANIGATWTGQGLDFDGVNDYIGVTGVTTGINHTISALIRTPNPSEYIFDSQSGRVVYTGANYYDGGWSYSGFTINDNKQHFVAVAKSGTSVSMNVDKLVYNNTGSSKSIGGLCNIGARYDQTSIYFFYGIMSNVNILNIALSANQIALMNDRPWALYEPVQRPTYYFLPSGVSIPVFMQNMRGNTQIGMRGGFIN